MLSSRASQLTLLILSVIVIAAGVLTYRFVTTPVVDDRVSELLFASESDGEYTDIAGEVVTLDRFAGKPLVVTTWASWCPHCTNELVLLNQVMQERVLSVPVVALNRNEPLFQIERFKDTLPELPMITFVVDSRDHFYAAALGYAMPETLVFSSRGEILYHARGNSDPQLLEAALAAATQ